MSAAGVVVVGAGQAGLQVAASLREGGYADPVTLLGDEATLPYQRPPLSKAYLAGKIDAAGLWLRPPSYFAEHRLDRREAHAVRIDRERRRVELADGEHLPYDHLVLATGSRNRRLPVPGADLRGVHQVRSITDADALRAALSGARRLVVVGGGFIGLEIAAVCAADGLGVTVVESADRLMARAVSMECATFFRGAQQAEGVTFQFEAGVVAIEGRNGRAAAVRLGDGTRLAADLVLVGIGVVPNQELAAEAGLATRDGVEVDGFLATLDPRVSAIGDCARFPSRFARGLTGGDRVRIESVQNALDQARCVAARLVGRLYAYDAVPWFWSDQGRHKLQIAGLSSPGDAAVVRRPASGPGFSVFRYREDRLSAVESIDRGADHMAARRLLASGRRVSPQQAADPGFDLKAFATA